MMPALAEVFRYVCAAETFLRCAVRSYFNKFSTSVFSFVAKEVEELRPSGITNTFSKVVVSDHAFDVQIFDGDQSIAVDEPTTNLVVKVRALLSDMRVRSLQKLNCFMSAIRTLLSARDFTLCSPQLRLRFSVIARAIYFSSIRKCCECSHLCQSVQKIPARAYIH